MKNYGLLFASLLLGAVAYGETVRMGQLGVNTPIVTAGESVSEVQLVSKAFATNTLISAESDTLATVTARGATTGEALTIGSRGEGAVGASSLANGANVVASGDNSHAQGSYTTASGYASHAEGITTTASGDASHAQGDRTTASGYASHAQGIETTASGDASHAEGDNTTASGYASHASGLRAEIAADHDYAFAWQGSTSELEEDTPTYYSHGPGTFNINPVGGLSGVWVGETNLATTLGGYATTGAVAAVQAEVGAGTNWLTRTGLSGTVAFANAGNRPQAWSGSGDLIVTEISGLAPPAQVYWTLQGFSSVTLPAGIYAVGGGTWQAGMVNHFTLWQVGDTTMITFLTATEIE